MNKLEGEEREAARSALTLLEEHAQQFVQSVNPDPDLMSATGPNFLVRALVDKKATFPEKLQFYLDDICGDREIIPGTKVPDIMPLRERIAEVASRRPEFNDDEALTKTLGGKFWDRELELGQAVEREIWERLGGEQSGIENPKDIPAFLRNELEKRIATMR